MDLGRRVVAQEANRQTAFDALLVPRRLGDEVMELRRVPSCHPFRETGDALASGGEQQPLDVGSRPSPLDIAEAKTGGTEPPSQRAIELHRPSMLVRSGQVLRAIGCLDGAWDFAKVFSFRSETGNKGSETGNGGDYVVLLRAVRADAIRIAASSLARGRGGRVARRASRRGRSVRRGRPRRTASRGSTEDSVHQESGLAGHPPPRAARTDGPRSTGERDGEVRSGSLRQARACVGTRYARPNVRRRS